MCEAPVLVARGSDSGGGVLVRKSGTAVFVFNLQTRMKRQPCVYAFACSEETHTRSISRTNCYRHSVVSVHKKLHVKAQTISLLIKSTAVRLYTQRGDKTFTTAKQLQCPEDIFP